MPGIEPRPSNPYPVTMLTELSRLIECMLIYEFILAKPNINNARFLGFEVCIVEKYVLCVLPRTPYFYIEAPVRRRPV
jgi:hypothetical protein